MTYMTSWIGTSNGIPGWLGILLYVVGAIATAYAHGRLLGLPEPKCTDVFSPAGWVGFLGLIWPVGLPAIIAVWAAVRGEQDRKAGP